MMIGNLLGRGICTEEPLSSAKFDGIHLDSLSLGTLEVVKGGVDIVTVMGLAAD